jgi:hypothetical protein
VDLAAGVGRRLRSALTDHAYALRQADRPTEARPFAELATELFPGAWPAHSGLATTYWAATPTPAALPAASPTSTRR